MEYMRHLEARRLRMLPFLLLALLAFALPTRGEVFDHLRGGSAPVDPLDTAGDEDDPPEHPKTFDIPNSVKQLDFDLIRDKLGEVPKPSLNISTRKPLTRKLP